MPRAASRVPTRCERCGDPLGAFSMSFFNEDVCCATCLADEREAPGYRDESFDGGLSPRDRAFLAAKLRTRRALEHGSREVLRLAAPEIVIVAAGAIRDLPRLFRGES
jgi:hypothetical protein